LLAWTRFDNRRLPRRLTAALAPTPYDTGKGWNRDQGQRGHGAHHEDDVQVERVRG
jgi:hypothetical protein